MSWTAVGLDVVAELMAEVASWPTPRAATLQTAIPYATRRPT